MPRPPVARVRRRWAKGGKRGGAWIVVGSRIGAPPRGAEFPTLGDWDPKITSSAGLTLTARLLGAIALPAGPVGRPAPEGRKRPFAALDLQPEPTGHERESPAGRVFGALGPSLARVPGDDGLVLRATTTPS